MMHYIIDGYNVIQSGPDELLAKGTLENKREFFLRLVTDFLAVSGGSARATVVFDGPESSPLLSGGASCVQRGRLQLCFSEGKTADERIEELALAEARPVDIVVVTNDKGIRRLLGTSGASFMGADEFAAKLFKKAGAAGAPVVEVPPADDKLNDELEKLWLKKK